MARVLAAAGLLLASLALACGEREPPPLDGLRQPSGISRSPDGRWLFVTNGNWDLAQSGGSLVLIDLERVAAAVSGSDVGCEHDEGLGLRICDAGEVIDESLSVVIPSAAGNIAIDLPKGTTGPWRILIPTRSPPTITWVDITRSGDDLRTDCGQDEHGRCDELHRITFVGSDPATSLPDDPASVFVDRQGFRYAYVPHLTGGRLSLLALDGSSGPELTDIESNFYLASSFEGFDLAGGFTVTQRPCSAEEAPNAARGCTRPYLYGAHRFWPGVRAFTVAPGLDVIVAQGTTSVLDLNPEITDQRPTMADVEFEEANSGTALLVVHSTPPGLSRIDTSLNDQGNPKNTTVATTTLCENPNMIEVYRPPAGEALAFVTCFGDDTLAVVSLASFSLVATVAVGRGPNELALDPNRGWLYVANARESTISVIDIDRTRATFLTERVRIGRLRAGTD